jgi:hypothetical protein
VTQNPVLTYEVNEVSFSLPPGLVSSNGPGRRTEPHHKEALDRSSTGQWVSREPERIGFPARDQCGAQNKVSQFTVIDACCRQRTQDLKFFRLGGKGAPAFKPATKGRSVSPAARPAKKKFDHPNYEERWAPALPKACFNALSGSQKP